MGTECLECDYCVEYIADCDYVLLEMANIDDLIVCNDCAHDLKAGGYVELVKNEPTRAYLKQMTWRATKKYFNQKIDEYQSKIDYNKNKITEYDEENNLFDLPQ